MTDPTSANIAIAKALGLDLTTIRKGGVRITLDGDLGPIVEVECFLTDGHGKRYTTDNDFVTELRRYKLVPLEETP